jgi:Fe-S-cluster-containing hydrogenase component 2
MIMFYFSGTGNSKFIAELFCKNMHCECVSIEENADFEKLAEAHEIIGFCYPIYASRAPRNLREFAQKYAELLTNKKLIIFCTQMLFSGDGARAFTYLFPRIKRKNMQIIYAEHFNLPNNVCNVFVTPLASPQKSKKLITKAERKMQIVCENIRSNVSKRRGFNPFSRAIGAIQPIVIPIMEKRGRKSVKVRDNCDLCGVCIEVCPMKNLVQEDAKITHKQNCIICYRCVNKCPQKAITTTFHARVKKQYKGI